MTTRRPITWSPPRSPLWLPTTHRRAAEDVTGLLLDVLSSSAISAHSVRRLTSVTWGVDDTVTDPLVRIRRDSDNDEQNFTYNGSGDLDAAGIATFVGAGSGFFAKWFDQSGNGKDATQVTTTRQPLYTASAINSLPAPTFDGNNDHLDADGIATSLSGDDVAWHFFCVHRQDNTPATQYFFNSLEVGNQGLLHIRWASTVYACNKRDDASAAANLVSIVLTTDPDVRVHDLDHSGTALTWKRDGTDILTEGASDLGVTTLDVFSYGRNTLALDGPLPEALFFTDPSSADASTIRQSMGDYYGVTIS